MRRPGHEDCPTCERCGLTPCPDCDTDDQCCTCYDLTVRSLRDRGSASMEFALMLTLIAAIIITAFWAEQALIASVLIDIPSQTPIATP